MSLVEMKTADGEGARRTDSVKPCVQMPRAMWEEFLEASRAIGLSASAHIRLLITRSTREIARDIQRRERQHDARHASSRS